MFVVSTFQTRQSHVGHPARNAAAAVAGGLLLLTLGTANAAQWNRFSICNSCETSVDFETLAANQAPVGDTDMLVFNLITDEVRRYDISKERSDVSIFSTSNYDIIINEQTVGTVEHDALNKLESNLAKSTLEFDRERFVLEAGDAPTVGEDLNSFQVKNLQDGIVQTREMDELLGNELTLGLSLVFSVTQTPDLSKIIRITINYSDGSKLVVEYTTSSGSWRALRAKAPDSTIIPILDDGFVDLDVLQLQDPLFVLPADNQYTVDGINSALDLGRPIGQDCQLDCRVEGSDMICSAQC